MATVDSLPVPLDPPGQMNIAVYAQDQSSGWSNEDVNRFCPDAPIAIGQSQ